VAFLFSGIFRGFSHLEKHFTESGLISRLEPVEQWFWVREGLFGEWEYNDNAMTELRHDGPPVVHNSCSYGLTRMAPPDQRLAGSKDARPRRFSAPLRGACPAEVANNSDLSGLSVILCLFKAPLPGFLYRVTHCDSGWRIL
jgi:hypothetical protein